MGVLESRDIQGFPLPKKALMILTSDVVSSGVCGVCSRRWRRCWRTTRGSGSSSWTAAAPSTAPCRSVPPRQTQTTVKHFGEMGGVSEGRGGGRGRSWDRLGEGRKQGCVAWEAEKGSGPVTLAVRLR